MKFKIILCVLIQLQILWFLGCSNSNQISNISNSDNNKLLVDFSNRESSNESANISNVNFRKLWKSEFDKTLAELEKHRLLWKEKQILNYDFVIAKYAGGQSNEWNRLPVLIKVRNGEKVSIEKVEKDRDYVIYSRIDGFEDFDTIDKLFDYLKQELDKGSILGWELHKTLNYPQQITLTFSFENHSYHNIVIEKLVIK